MLTVNMLNFNRTENLKRIVSRLVEYDIVEDVRVWNNRVETPLRIEHPKVMVINPSRDIGLNTRWSLGCLNTTECTLTLDDDVLLSEEQISILYEGWLKDKDRIHSFWGRIPTEYNEYADFVDNKEGEANIVITKAACFSTVWIPVLLTHIQTFGLSDWVPKNRHEDIYLSYVVRNETKKMHRIHRHDKINGREIDYLGQCRIKDWSKERTAFMHECQTHFCIE